MRRWAVDPLRVNSETIAARLNGEGVTPRMAAAAAARSGEEPPSTAQSCPAGGEAWNHASVRWREGAASRWMRRSEIAPPTALDERALSGRRCQAAEPQAR